MRGAVFSSGRDFVVPCKSCPHISVEKDEPVHEQSSRLDRIMTARADQRRAVARDRARLVFATLKDLGVEARLVGSLAKGTFHGKSDVDFLILSAPGELKYALEAKVEAVMADIPFDVLYLEDLNDRRRNELLESMVDASDLH